MPRCPARQQRQQGKKRDRGEGEEESSRRFQLRRPRAMKRRNLDSSNGSGSQSEPDFIGDYPESYTVDTAAGQEKFQLAGLFWGAVWPSRPHLSRRFSCQSEGCRKTIPHALRKRLVRCIKRQRVRQWRFSPPTDCRVFPWDYRRLQKFLALRPCRRQALHHPKAEKYFARQSAAD